MLSLSLSLMLLSLSRWNDRGGIPVVAATRDDEGPAWTGSGGDVVEDGWQTEAGGCDGDGGGSDVPAPSTVKTSAVSNSPSSAASTVNDAGSAQERELPGVASSITTCTSAKDGGSEGEGSAEERPMYRSRARCRLAARVGQS